MTIPSMLPHLQSLADEITPEPDPQKSGRMCIRWPESCEEDCVYMNSRGWESCEWKMGDP